MHVRHEGIFEWLPAHLPGSRLYGGPYCSDGVGRLIMVPHAGGSLRGDPGTLVQRQPLYARRLRGCPLDTMCERYASPLTAREASGALSAPRYNPDDAGSSRYHWRLLSRLLAAEVFSIMEQN